MQKDCGRLRELNHKGSLLRPWSWSLMRFGHLQEVCNCSDFSGKILVFWIGGRLWEMVAHGGLEKQGNKLISFCLEQVLSLKDLVAHLHSKPPLGLYLREDLGCQKKSKGDGHLILSSQL